MRDILPQNCSPQAYAVGKKMKVSYKKTVEVAKNKILQNGAKGVLMSGSGSCIYGIFDNKNTAKKAYEILKNQYETYICVSYNKGSKKCLVKEK